MYYNRIYHKWLLFSYIRARYFKPYHIIHGQFSNRQRDIKAWFWKVRESRLTFRLLLHVSRMFSILPIFSSEINIAVTVDSRGSGLFGLEVSGTVCNLSARALENSDTLLNDWPANSSTERKNKVAQMEYKMRTVQVDGLNFKTYLIWNVEFTQKWKFLQYPLTTSQFKLDLLDSSAFRLHQENWKLLFSSCFALKIQNLFWTKIQLWDKLFLHVNEYTMTDLTNLFVLLIQFTMRGSWMRGGLNIWGAGLWCQAPPKKLSIFNSRRLIWQRTGETRKGSETEGTVEKR